MSTDFVFKLLMLGEASVGKTSLTHRFITNIFVESPRLTIGVDFFSKKIKLEDGKKVKLQIWDFGGEERFRFLLPTYSKGSNAGLFLYDITSTRTLESLPIWLEIIRKNAGNIPIILVGSKMDLDVHREVPIDLAKEFANKYLCAAHVELSAKTGENVEDSFHLITDLLLKESKRLVEEWLQGSNNPVET